MSTNDDIIRMLKSRASEDYRRFHCRLIPNLPADSVIGVPTPELRLIARQLDERSAGDFMSTLPHRYYEENNLHALLIMRISDFDSCMREVDRLLPYIDNWASCDILRPAAFKKEPGRLRAAADGWIRSGRTYTVRFGIKMLMLHFLDNRFDESCFDAVINVKSDDYYVNMMRAWYFAEALVKQHDSAVKVLSSRRLDKWTHNKAIQKACESLRIAPDEKLRLKDLRRAEDNDFS